MKLTAKSVLTPDGWQSDCTVETRDNIIVAVRPATGAERKAMLPGKLVPGFIDTQVNGGGGVLFNQQPSVPALRTMAQAHLQFGTTGLLPTVITDEAQVMAKAADAVAHILEDNNTSVIGIHFEGPFLSVEKKGVHSASLIRTPSDAELATLARNDIGNVLVTLAPENADGGLIRELVAAGVRVSLGHTNASYEQAMQAVNAGATGFTHLYNAMSAMTSRAPGVVGAALDSPHTFAGLIADHHHVHPASARVAIRAKGAGQIMLVTDAMAHVGSDMVTMPFFDDTIIRDGSRLTTPDGTLAGSCLDMHTAVMNTYRDLGVSLAQALRMASLNPARFLGLDPMSGQVAPSCRANLVLLNEKTLAVEKVWLNGTEVSHSSEEA